MLANAVGVVRALADTVMGKQRDCGYYGSSICALLAIVTTANAGWADLTVTRPRRQAGIVPSSHARGGSVGIGEAQRDAQ